MSGLLFKYLLLVVAAAMTGVTAFTVAPVTAPRIVDVASPELVTGDALVSPPPERPPVLPSVPLGTGETVEGNLGSIEPIDPEPVVLAFGGDILIHSNVRAAASVGGSAYDFGPMFGPMTPAVRSADLAICHLEVPLTSSNSDLSTYPRFNAPRETATAIANAGFDGCSTASNHSIDKGVDGLLDTLDILEAAGVDAVGTYRTEEESRHATLHRIDGGPTVAHISATYWLNGLRTPEGQDWLAQRIDTDQILDMAERAKASGADLVVVSVHCCTEYRRDPTSEQVEIFDRLIRSDAVDLVVGHHSHVVGPVARVGEEFVLYGLGNLLSGQLHRVDTSEGVLAFATAEWEGERWEFVSVEALPVYVERGSYVVRLAEPGSGSYQRTMVALASFGVEVGLYRE